LFKQRIVIELMGAALTCHSAQHAVDGSHKAGRPSLAVTQRHRSAIRDRRVTTIGWVIKERAQNHIALTPIYHPHTRLIGGKQPNAVFIGHSNQ
jgi:hypothetical protein